MDWEDPMEHSPLRMEIRALLEKGEFRRGVQIRLARKYKVTVARVSQIACSEKERLDHPVRWEVNRATKRGKPFRDLHFYLKFKREGHPAFRQKDPED